MIDVEQGVYETISATFGGRVSDLGRDTLAPDVDGWDSLGHVTLLMLLERRFGVQIGDDDSRRLECVGALIDLIEAQLARKADAAQGQV